MDDACSSTRGRGGQAALPVPAAMLAAVILAAGMGGIGGVGCAQNEGDATVQLGPVTAAAQAHAGDRPTIADDGPERVASVTILGDELLWTLGPQSRARTVAVSPLVDDPRYSTSIGRWPADVRRLSRNPAELIAADPELVLVATFTDQEYRAAVANHVRLLELRDFTGFEGYLDNLARVAKATGHIEDGQRLREDFLRRIEAVRARRPVAKVAPTCLAWAHGSVPGAETTFHAAATAAGCIDIPAEAGLVGHRRVDAEQLIAWDPDFIVLSCRDGEHCDQAARQFGERAGFARLRAVQQGHLIMVEPPYLSTTGAGMATLAERIQAGLRRGGVDAPAPARSFVTSARTASADVLQCGGE